MVWHVSINNHAQIIVLHVVINFISILRSVLYLGSLHKMSVEFYDFFNPMAFNYLSPQ